MLDTANSILRIAEFSREIHTLQIASPLRALSRIFGGSRSLDQSLNRLRRCFRPSSAWGARADRRGGDSLQGFRERQDPQRRRRSSACNSKASFRAALPIRPTPIRQAAECHRRSAGGTRPRPSRPRTSGLGGGFFARAVSGLSPKCGAINSHIQEMRERLDRMEQAIERLDGNNDQIGQQRRV